MQHICFENTQTIYPIQSQTETVLCKHTIEIVGLLNWRRKILSCFRWHSGTFVWSVLDSHSFETCFPFKHPVQFPESGMFFVWIFLRLHVTCVSACCRFFFVKSQTQTRQVSTYCLTNCAFEKGTLIECRQSSICLHQPKVSFFSPVMFQPPFWLTQFDECLCSQQLKNQKTLFYSPQTDTQKRMRLTIQRLLFTLMHLKIVHSNFGFELPHQQGVSQVFFCFQLETSQCFCFGLTSQITWCPLVRELNYLNCPNRKAQKTKTNG